MLSQKSLLPQESQQPIAPLAPPSFTKAKLQAVNGRISDIRGSRFQNIHSTSGKGYSTLGKKVNADKSLAYLNEFDKSRFYNAPRQMEIVDSRRSGSYSAKQVQLQAEPMAEESVPQRSKQKEFTSAKDLNSFSPQNIGGVGGYGTEGRDESAISNETYQNSGTPLSPPISKSTADMPQWGASRPRPELKALSRTDFLAGATNGTLGPQASDSGSYDSSQEYAYGQPMGVREMGQRDFLIGREKMPMERARRVDSYNFESEKRSDSFSPLDGVMSKLNNLSAAAGVSSAGSTGSAGSFGAIGDSEQSYRGSYGRNTYGLPTGETEQFKAGDRGTDRDKSLEAMLVGIAFAFIVMTIVFFRLLAKLKNDEFKSQDNRPIK